jgi:hypothetical protein
VPQSRNACPAVASKRGPKPRPVVEFPTPLSEAWLDPPHFGEALTLHVRRHGETYWSLHRAIIREGETFDRKTLQNWAAGTKMPRSAVSLRMLGRIEHRYGLHTGYFAAKLPVSGRAVVHTLPGLPPAERRRIAWHLPDDFDERSNDERQEIIDWVRRVIVTGSTAFRQFQAEALRTRYGLRFPEFLSVDRQTDNGGDVSRQAPPELAREVAALVRFKTATLTAIGECRRGVWGEETATQKVEHLGLMFGAIAADPGGPVRGLGASRGGLSLALLVAPAVWDWYLGWREARRGFFTAWEADMLELAKALTRKDTGWLRQNPQSGFSRSTASSSDRRSRRFKRTGTGPATRCTGTRARA